jgi:hypothetical protein
MYRQGRPIFADRLLIAVHVSAAPACMSDAQRNARHLKDARRRRAVIKL